VAVDHLVGPVLRGENAILKFSSGSFFCIVHAGALPQPAVALIRLPSNAGHSFFLQLGSYFGMYTHMIC
jgi:hypothetical protein